MFEGWSYLAALGVTQQPELREAVLTMLRRVFGALAPIGRRLVVAVPPLVPQPGRGALLSQQDVADLLAFADALSGRRGG